MLHRLLSHAPVWAHADLLSEHEVCMLQDCFAVHARWQHGMIRMQSCVVFPGQQPVPGLAYAQLHGRPTVSCSAHGPFAQ